MTSTTAEPKNTGYDNVEYLVFDTSYLAHRNAHGYERFKTPDGRRSGHVYGSFIQVKRLCWQLKPRHVVFLYDRGAPWRKALVPDYKATRRAGTDDNVTIPELDVTVMAPEPEEDWTPAPDVERLFRTFPGIHLANDDMEADDMAGWFAGKVRKLPRMGRGATVFYTADKDYWQLVDDNERICCLLSKRPQGNPRAKNVLHWVTEDTVQNAFGVSPKYIARLKAVLGDASDNIRGVEGGSRPGKKDALRKLVTSLEGDDYFDPAKPCPPLNSTVAWLQNELRDQRDRILINHQVTDLLGRGDDNRITASSAPFQASAARLADCLGVLVEFSCDSLLAQAEPFFKELTRPRERMIAAFG